MSKYYFLHLLILLFKLITCEEIIYNIKDFRSNPMGIAQREDLFQVNLNIPDNSRVVSYTDFNNDK